LTALVHGNFSGKDNAQKIAFLVLAGNYVAALGGEALHPSAKLRNLGTIQILKQGDVVEDLKNIVLV
jgi:hypothetical protein